MTIYNLRHLLILAICILITGCGIQPPTPEGQPTATVGSPLPCDEIVHPALLSVPFEDFEQGPDAIESWILTEFPTSTISYPGEGYYTWQEDEKTFQIVLVSPVQSISQVSRWEPTIGNLLSCFGDPGFFSIFRIYGIEASGVALDIWYPDHGMIFATSSFGQNTVRKFTATSKMDKRVVVVTPGTPEGMMRNASNWDEELLKTRLTLLQAWPENFTELTLEE